MPTVREIAEQASVSISTVSLALNDKPGVADSTRQRILGIAAALRSQELARAKEARGNGQAAASDRPFSILILHPAQVGDDVFTKFLRGIWAAVANTTTQLQMMINEPDFIETNVAQLLFSEPDLAPDGVIVLGAKKEEFLVNKVLALGIPCVICQRETDNAALSAVGVDEIQMAADATEYLLELGHRAIAFAGGKPGYSYTDGRIAGYRRAMQAHGIEVPDRWVALTWDRAATESIIHSSPEVTAYVFLDDGYALQFGLPALEAAGYRIPDDISVLAFDDIKEVAAYTPPITSVTLPFFEMSFRAIKILEEQIRDATLQSQHIRFKTTLSRRASCGPPRASS
jgi:DNA-binding LacI/PurR family transcriptional regulator